MSRPLPLLVALNAYLLPYTRCTPQYVPLDVNPRIFVTTASFFLVLVSWNSANSGSVRTRSVSASLCECSCTPTLTYRAKSRKHLTSGVVFQITWPSRPPALSAATSTEPQTRSVPLFSSGPLSSPDSTVQPNYEHGNRILIGIISADLALFFFAKFWFVYRNNLRRKVWVSKSSYTIPIAS